MTHLSLAWLDGWAPENGRLLVPVSECQLDRRLPVDHPQSRRNAPLPRTLRHVDGGIIPCVGGRNPTAEAQLKAALARSGYDTIRSLRRAPDEPDAEDVLVSGRRVVAVDRGSAARKDEAGDDMNLVPHQATPLTKSVSSALPAIIADAGDKAARRYLEFFAVTIENSNTRAVYFHAAGASSPGASVRPP